MRIPRMSGWYLATAGLIAGIWLTAPQQLSVVLYKVQLVALAVVMSYVADRSMFARMGDALDGRLTRDVVSAARVVARGLVFLGTMLGVTLGI